MSEDITSKDKDITADLSLEYDEKEDISQSSENTLYENEDFRPPLYCDVCNIKVTSNKILLRHLDGRRHKSRVERQGKSYRCELCDINANSETQLNIHMNSSKHKARLQRKEMGPLGCLITSKVLWLFLFCILCICLNLFIIFKVVL